MHRTSFARSIALALSGSLCFAGCGKSETASAQTAETNTERAAAPAAAAPSDKLVQLSTYGRSLYCSLAQAPDGTLHAIYTDQPDGLRNSYLYYRASTDNGATWSEPKNLSDDESGLSCYFDQVRVDGKGRVYAIWKYLTAASDTLDGPGSACCGILAYRCLEGGNWSKTVRLSTKNVPSTSFFAAVAPDGNVNLIWAAGTPDRDWAPWGGVQNQDAGLIRQAVLDGAAAPTPRTLITPRHVPTPAEVDAAHAAGHDIPPADRVERHEGLWNLRGYVDKSGLAHFVGEHFQEYGIESGSPKNYYVEFDGHALHKLWTVENAINLNNPPMLLVDAAGKEHLIRTPENAERMAVRDYAIADGEIGDHVDIVGPDKPEGAVVNWQAAALPGGRMAVTCAVSQKGGWDPDDVELYVSTTDAGGKWSKPVCVTNNAARRAFMSKQTAAGGVMTSDRYQPAFAETIALKDGGLGLLMVNKNISTLGVTNNAISGSGKVYGMLASGSTAAPWVFFKKL